MQKGQTMCANFIPAGISDANWATLPPRMQEMCRQDADYAARVAAKLKENPSAFSKTQGTVPRNLDKGVTLENSSPNLEHVRLTGNKELQEKMAVQREQVWLKNLKNDKKMAQDIIVDTIYNKEKAELMEYYQNLAKSNPDAVKFKLYEVLDDKEKAKFNEVYNRIYDEYSNDKELAKKRFNAEYSKLFQDLPIKENHAITEDELKAISHKMAMYEALNMGNEQYEKLAKSVITDRHFIKSAVHERETKAQIQQLQKEGKTEEAKALESQLIEDVKAAKVQEDKEFQQNIKLAAKLLGNADVANALAKEKFDNTVVHWDKKEKYDKNDGFEHNILNNDLREMVQEFPEFFATEVDAEQSDFSKDVMINGQLVKKHYKFSAQKYKEEMLALANEHDVKTEDEKDPYYKADYNASVGNRDTFTRDLYEKMYDRKLAAIDEQLKSKSTSLAEKAYLEQQRILTNEARNKYMKNPTWGGRKEAGKAFKTAGIDVTKDKTGWIRAGSIAADLGKAGIAGGALALGSEAVSLLKNGKYSGVVNWATSLTVKASEFGKLNFKDVKFTNGTGDGSTTGVLSNVKATGTIKGVPVELTQEGVIMDGKLVDPITLGDDVVIENIKFETQVPISASKDVNLTSNVWQMTDDGQLVKIGSQTTTETITFNDLVNVSGTTDYKGYIELTGGQGQTVRVQLDDVTLKDIIDAHGELSDVEGTGTSTGKTEIGKGTAESATGTVDDKAEITKEKSGEEHYSGNNAKNSIKWANIGWGALIGMVGALPGAIVKASKKYDKGINQFDNARIISAKHRMALRKSEQGPLKASTDRLLSTGERPDLSDVQIVPKEVYGRKVEGQEIKFKSSPHTVKKGEYPMAIISSAYGVAPGTKEYNEIAKVVYEDSGYKPGHNLRVGDKFTLRHDIEVNGKMYSPKNNYTVDAGTVKDNGLKTARLKNYGIEGGKGGYTVYDYTIMGLPPRPLRTFKNKSDAEAYMNKLNEQDKQSGKVAVPEKDVSEAKKEVERFLKGLGYKGTL